MAWRGGYGPSEVRELWGLTQNAYNTIPSFVEFVHMAKYGPYSPSVSSFDGRLRFLKMTPCREREAN